jgi:hypothetical protein
MHRKERDKANKWRWKGQSQSYDLARKAGIAQPPGF